ncbi:Transient receptor putative cation channel sub V member 6 [Branchiostoma belcheri]|nr:Transient receptor putative cation channel sub V member 6 [Branchiostoma belcheri]
MATSATEPGAGPDDIEMQPLGAGPILQPGVGAQPADYSIRDLYIALLKDDEERALDILNRHPDFATMACTYPEHYGESPLHLAIFNRNTRLVQELVIPEYNADTNARCTGTRFSTAQRTEEEDVLFYYGLFLHIEKPIHEPVTRTHLREHDLEREVLPKCFAQYITGFAQAQYALLTRYFQEHSHIAQHSRCIRTARLVGISELAQSLQLSLPAHTTRPVQWPREYVLSLAACLGMKDIVRCLVEHGARLDNTDSKGNTVLHVLANMEHANCSMAKLVLELVEKQLKTLEEQLDNRQISQDQFNQLSRALDLEKVQNNVGLTPAMLAVASANLEMFQFLLENNPKHHVLWKYGPVSECLYDLSEIDTCPQGYTLLEVAVFSDVYRLYDNIKAARMIEATPIKQLLEEKWRCVRLWFWAFAVIYFIHIIIFTACCWNRPLENVVKNVTNGTDNVMITVMEKVPWRESYNTPPHRARGAGELFTVITSLTFVLGFFFIEPAKRYDFMKKHYSMKTLTYIFFNAFGYGIGNGPFRFLSLVYVIAVEILMILRLADSPGEDVVMSIALVFGWMLMLYFSRGSQHLGPFTIIIHRQANEDLEQFSDFGNTFFTLFKLTIGVEDIAVLNKAPNPSIAVILFISFLIFSFLLMANLLIAIMGETLGVVSDAGWKNLWKLQRASLIILFEQRYRWCLRCVPRRLMQFAGEHVDDLMVHPNTRYLKVKLRGKPEAGKETKLTPPDQHEDLHDAPSRCCGGCFGTRVEQT